MIGQQTKVRFYLNDHRQCYRQIATSTEGYSFIAELKTYVMVCGSFQLIFLYTHNIHTHLLFIRIYTMIEQSYALALDSIAKSVVLEHDYDEQVISLLNPTWRWNSMNEA